MTDPNPHSPVPDIDPSRGPDEVPPVDPGSPSPGQPDIDPGSTPTEVPPLQTGAQLL